MSKFSLEPPLIDFLQCDPIWGLYTITYVPTTQEDKKIVTIGCNSKEGRELAEQMSIIFRNRGEPERIVHGGGSTYTLTWLEIVSREDMLSIVSNSEQIDLSKCSQDHEWDTSIALNHIALLADAVGKESEVVIRVDYDSYEVADQFVTAMRKLGLNVQDRQLGDPRIREFTIRKHDVSPIVI